MRDGMKEMYKGKCEHERSKSCPPNRRREEGRGSVDERGKTKEGPWRKKQEATRNQGGRCKSIPLPHQIHYSLNYISLADTLNIRHSKTLFFTRNLSDFVAPYSTS